MFFNNWVIDTKVISLKLQELINILKDFNLI